MPAPNEITPQQLLRLIGTPDCPAIVDVCLPEDFAKNPYLVPSSFQHDHSELEGLRDRLDGRSAVIICQKGKKLSQGTAAWLRTEGIKAEYLSGGALGWKDTPHAPFIPFERYNESALWVTRHRPKIDRIACPWLIRRFVKRDARFLFVAPDQVELVAERFNAQPFDTVDTYYGHRGELSTFDTMLKEFGLQTEPLMRMANVIRAADTGHHQDAAEAAGLLAISVGLSRWYKDDLQQLEAAMPLYDAFYRWARDGFDETHSWDKGHDQ